MFIRKLISGAVIALVAVIAALLMVGLVPTAAHADAPVDVDCDLLASTNAGVDAFLDLNNIEFDNLGDFESTQILDDTASQALRDLTLLFSGGAIDFDSASQALSTNAACGLIPQLIDEIRD